MNQLASAVPYPLPPAPFELPPNSLRGRLYEAWYDLVYWGSMATMNLGFSLRTEGDRHVPRTGPALLIANHQSYLDPTLVGLASRRHLCYLARKSLFRHRLLARIMRSLNAVPVDQEGIGIEGLRMVLNLLQAGQAVVVFPEGSRTETGQMDRFMPGIHLILKRTKAPIVPVGIAGAYTAWPRGCPLPTPAPLFLPAADHTISVVVGRPLDGRHYAALPREKSLAELHEVVYQVHLRAEKLRRKSDP